MSGRAVAAALDAATARHGKSKTMTVDHGPKFSSRALDEWAYRCSITRGLEEHDPGVAGRLQPASTPQLAGSTETPRVLEAVRGGGRRSFVFSSL